MNKFIHRRLRGATEALKIVGETFPWRPAPGRRLQPPGGATDTPLVDAPGDPVTRCGGFSDAGGGGGGGGGGSGGARQGWAVDGWRGAARRGGDGGGSTFLYLRSNHKVGVELACAHPSPGVHLLLFDATYRALPPAAYRACVPAPCSAWARATSRAVAGRASFVPHVTRPNNIPLVLTLSRQHHPPAPRAPLHTHALRQSVLGIGAYARARSAALACVDAAGLEAWLASPPPPGACVSARVESCGLGAAGAGRHRGGTPGATAGSCWTAAHAGLNRSSSLFHCQTTPPYLNRTPPVVCTRPSLQAPAARGLAARRVRPPHSAWRPTLQWTTSRGAFTRWTGLSRWGPVPACRMHKHCLRHPPRLAIEAGRIHGRPQIIGAWSVTP
jgi:hypothetical protein